MFEHFKTRVGYIINATYGICLCYITHSIQQGEIGTLSFLLNSYYYGDLDFLYEVGT